MHALLIAEREHDLVLFAVANGSSLFHCERHSDCRGGLTLHPLRDGHGEGFDRNCLATWLLISQG